MLTHERSGFTLVEITIAIVILSVGILGIASSTASLLVPVNSAEDDFVALQAVEDQLSEIRLDPRYGGLDTLYAGTDSTLVGLPGAVRTTAFARTQTAGTGGKTIDYWTVTVTVTGGGLNAPVARKLILGPA